jgi:hypothetical protein
MHGVENRKLRGVIARACSVVGLGLCSLKASAALACSLVEPPEPATFTPSDDDVPPLLKSAHLDVRRADDPGSSGDGDCGDIGGYTFVVDAEDDVTRPKDLAYSLKLVKGTLPFVLPDQPVLATFSRSAGKLSSWFSDDGKAFDATIAVAMVDSAGNFSEPVEVHASGDAVGCGCAWRAGHPSAGAAWLVVGALLFTRRSRRVRPPWSA